MRILFSSLAAYGHTFPLIPLAVAARNAGHEVVFATGSEFHPALSSAGLVPFEAGMPIGEAFGIALRSDPEFTGQSSEGPGSVDPEQRERAIGRVFGALLPRRFLDDLGPLLRDEKFDLVVHEQGNAGAGFAARLAGVPGVCHGFGRIMRDGFNRIATQSLKEIGAECGVPDLQDYVIAQGNPYLDIYPPSLQDPEFLAHDGRIELRPVPFAEPGELPAVVARGDKPLVYLTLGTAYGAIAVLREAIEGLAGLGVRVLVATGKSLDGTELGAVPDDVTVVPWLPQAELLPHLDLVVHHGGAGTTLGALGAGVPQLLLPQGADQFVNAEAVAGFGAGIRIVGDDFSADAVATAAKELLNSEKVAANVRELAAEVAAMPSPNEVAARLPEFAHL